MSENGTWIIYSESSEEPMSSPELGGETTDKSFLMGEAMSVVLIAIGILIFMFLIMKIFEHFFKPINGIRSNNHAQWLSIFKLRNQQVSELPVLMPGQQYPTCIARPTPLPCQRENTHLPFS
ncbi:uncharacterized protein LOC124941286 [Impatiens glandulifera]|uniref:uncharacterized protein LOC124941286 n=1 Tax=Impatiens glandulifera TaxID=253017 RepID=UPI001FB1258D|nr:uncharacterized protein LOC124941286 [Impatiens glandulifera]